MYSVFFNSLDHSAFETDVFLSQVYPLEPVHKGDDKKVTVE